MNGIRSKGRFSLFPQTGTERTGKAFEHARVRQMCHVSRTFSVLFRSKESRIKFNFCCLFCTETLGTDLINQSDLLL